MGATLAAGGVGPVKGARVVDPAVCHRALVVMTTAGPHGAPGEWLHERGLPGKPGIGGAIATVSPGKGGRGTFAPPLEAYGNRSRGSPSPGSCPGGWA